MIETGTGERYGIRAKGKRRNIGCGRVICRSLFAVLRRFSSPCVQCIYESEEKYMKKRLVSLCMVLLMVLCLIPVTALATPASSYSAAYSATKKLLSDKLNTYTFHGNGGNGNEDWFVFDLARAGVTIPESYCQTVTVDKISTLSEAIHAVLALSAAGKTVSSEMLTELASYTDTAYYPTDVSSILLAFNTKNYSIPAGYTMPDGGALTKESLISYLLADQNAATGAFQMPDYYNPGSSVDDLDTTGMAVQALAPYYDTDTAVRSAIDKALTYMGQQQNADGSFSAWGSPSAETTAQVIVALTAMGLDPAKYYAHSCIDGLLTLSLSEGGFIAGWSQAYNDMSTYEGFYALVAYRRYLAGKNALYDMTADPVKHHSSSTETVSAVPAAQTGDMGVVMYGAMALASVLGTAALSRRRREDV